MLKFLMVLGMSISIAAESEFSKLGRWLVRAVCAGDLVDTRSAWRSLEGLSSVSLEQKKELWALCRLFAVDIADGPKAEAKSKIVTDLLRCSDEWDRFENFFSPGSNRAVVCCGALSLLNSLFVSQEWSKWSYSLIGLTCIFCGLRGYGANPGLSQRRAIVAFFDEEVGLEFRGVGV